MAAGALVIIITGQQQVVPDEAELAELARLRGRFRGSHHIYRHVTPERGVRYMAHGATPGARPHTVITGDLAELRDELEQSVPKQLLQVSLRLRPRPDAGDAMLNVKVIGS